MSLRYISYILGRSPQVARFAVRYELMTLLYDNNVITQSPRSLGIITIHISNGLDTPMYVRVSCDHVIFHIYSDVRHTFVRAVRTHTFEIL